MRHKIAVQYECTIEFINVPREEAYRGLSVGTQEAVRLKNVAESRMWYATHGEPTARKSVMPTFFQVRGRARILCGMDPGPGRW